MSVELLRPTKFYQCSGELFWGLNQLLVSARIEEEGMLPLAKEQLQKGSLIVYFNHTNLLDPAVVFKFIGRRLTPLPNVSIFSSLKHLDPKRGLPYLFHGFVQTSVAASRGFTLLPIVQVDDHKSYPNYQGINFVSSKEALRRVKTAGQVVCLSPEGTRSKTGTLTKAEKGIEALLRAGQENSLALPLGIIGMKNFPLSTVSLIVGKPISYQEAQAESKELGLPIKDILMVRLGKLLPESYWGIYAQEIASSF